MVLPSLVASVVIPVMIPLRYPLKLLVVPAPGSATLVIALVTP